MDHKDTSGPRGADALAALSLNSLANVRAECAAMLEMVDRTISSRNGTLPPAQQGIYLVHGRTGVWLQVNDRLCDILGYARDELLGINAARVLRPGEDMRATEPAVVDAVLKILQGEWQRAEFDTWMQCRNRKRVWFHCTVTWDPMSEAWLCVAELLEGDHHRQTLVRGFAALVVLAFLSAELIDLVADGKLNGVFKLCNQLIRHAFGLL